MSDEYLWDRSGEPDPLVAELEDKLAGLAFEPMFLLEEAAPAAAPEPTPRASGWRAYAIGSAATAAAIACSVALYWCGYRAGSDAPQVDPAAQPVIVGTPEATAPIDEPPPSVEEHEPAVEPIVDGEEAEELPPQPQIADARDVKAKNKGKTKTKTGSDPLADLPSSSTSAGKSSTSSSSSSSSSSSTSSSSKGQDLDVDCMLDPQRCGKGKGSSSSSSSSKPAGGSDDPNLPERLSTTDIRDGIAPIKSAAKACGAKHGAKPGEKVKIKLSIAGATGEVTSAVAEAPHTTTPLGLCVAAVTKRAKFKRFQKASIGAVYPFTM